MPRLVCRTTEERSVVFTTGTTVMYPRHTHTHTRLMALFRDYPGEPLPER